MTSSSIPTPHLSPRVNATASIIPQIRPRHILNKMGFSIILREPEIPRHDKGLDLVSQPPSVRDGLDDRFGLFKRDINARSAKLLVGFKGLFHGVGFALFDPARETAGEEDSVFEDDAGAFALRGHSVLFFCFLVLGSFSVGFV